MTTRGSVVTRASAGRASASSDGDARANGAAARAPSQDARPAAGRRAIAKGGRRGRGGRAGGRRKGIWLKLRCRPPQGAEGSVPVADTVRQLEEKEGVRGKDKVRDGEKGRGKGKSNDRFKGMTPAEKDAEEQSKKYQRLAKARAVKAKRREAAMKEKSAASAANVAAVRPEPPPAEKPAAATVGSISQKLLPRKRPADTLEITPSAAVVKSPARSSGTAPVNAAANEETLQSPRPAHGAEKVAAETKQPLRKMATQAELAIAVDSGGNNPQEYGNVLKAIAVIARNRELPLDVGQGEADELSAQAPAADGAQTAEEAVKAAEDGVSKCMAKLSFSEDSKSDIVSDASVQPPSERIDFDPNARKQFANKTDAPRPRFGLKAGSQMPSADAPLRDLSDNGQFSDEVQPVYIAQRDMLVVPTHRSNNRSDQNSVFPTHGSNEVRKAYVGIERRTPEHRPIAKMTTLAQPARADTNPPSRWGGMSLDAKNEALLTLAKEQKGNIKRRPSSASCSLDRDMFSRSAKHLGRTDNVPESERKRIQVTAMAAESRVRSFHEPRTSLQPGTPIGRLLQDPTASGSVVHTNPTAAGPQTQKGHEHCANHVKGMELGSEASSGNPRGENFLNAADQTMPRNFESATFASRVPDVQDARGCGIQVADYSSAQAGTSPGGGSGRHTGLWGGTPHQHAEAARDINRLPTVNASSQSGSHSEPGSSAAGAPTVVHTFKRTRKRPTLAVVHRTPAQRPSGVGSDIARSSSWRSRVQEEPQAVYNNRGAVLTRGDTRMVGQRLSTVAKPGHQLSSRELSSSCVPSQLGNNPADLSGARSSGDFSDVGMETRTRGHLYPHESSTEPRWSRAHEYADRAGEATVARPGSDRLSSSIQYQAPASTRGHRGADGGGDMHRLPHVAPAEASDPIQQQSLRVSTGLNEPLYCAGFERSTMEDGMNFPESSRRLRRSAAPTLPTATRRFQYEQGRQLARFTPSTTPGEQQAYSSLRRRSSAPRLPENPAQVHTSEWDTRGEEHASGTRPAQVQSGFASQGSGGPVLSHEYISQEGVRPSLAPVPPVVYEPEGNVRTQNEMTTGADDISRLHNTHRSPVQSLRSVDGGYKSQSMSSTDYGRPVHHNQHLSQSREASASLQHNRSRADSPQAQMVGTRNVVVTRTSMRGNAGVYAGSPDRVLRPAGAAFSPSSLPRGELHQDEPRTARSMQQSRRPRTDPSLKNLLT